MAQIYVFVMIIFLESPRIVYDIDDYIKVTVATFQKIHQCFAESLSPSKEDMITCHKDASFFYLNVSDIVFSLVYVTSAKLNPNSNSPLRLIAKLHGNMVKLLHF